VSSLVRPEFGPSLPALLRERFGVSERVTIALVVLLVVVAGFVAVVVRPGDPGDTHYVYEGDPVFNVSYSSDALDRVEPRDDELLRLEGERGPQSVTITVRPLSLPAFDGDVSHAGLPVYASGHEERLRAATPGFEFVGEGRARVGGSPGYEIEFRSGPPDARTFGSDVMVVQGEDDADGAVLLSLRRTVTGPLSEDDRRFSTVVRSAFRSFAYGRDPF
jgi:hypothetical protein